VTKRGIVLCAADACLRKVTAIRTAVQGVSVRTFATSFELPRLTCAHPVKAAGKCCGLLDCYSASSDFSALRLFRWCLLRMSWDWISVCTCRGHLGIWSKFQVLHPLKTLVLSLFSRDSATRQSLVRPLFIWIWKTGDAQLSFESRAPPHTLSTRS